MADKTRSGGSEGGSRATRDGLLDNRLTFFQPAEGYRSAIDPVFLAAAVPAGAGDIVLDAGTGAGAAGLCLLYRVPGCSVVGSDIDPDMRSLAEKNIAANRYAGRYSVTSPDDLPTRLPAGGFSHAMSNPPYWQAARGTRSATAGKALSNHESGLSTEAWIAGVAIQVQKRGTMTVVFPAARLAALVSALDRVAGDITIFPLWPKAGRDAKRVVVRAKVGSNGPTRLMAGMVLHNEDGGFTDAAEAVLRGGARLVM